MCADGSLQAGRPATVDFDGPCSGVGLLCFVYFIAESGFKTSYLIFTPVLLFLLLAHFLACCYVNGAAKISSPAV